MKLKKPWIIIGISLVLLSVIAYNVYNNTQAKIDMYGRISKVTVDGQGQVQEIVMENTQADKQPYDQAIVLVRTKTKIVSSDAKKIELEEGQIVGIVFKEGPILMIYPPRIEAKTIKIMEYSAKPEARNIPKEEAIMTEYETLVKDGAGLTKILEMLTQNIALLSPENASITLHGLEAVQMQSLPSLEAKYYDEQVQNQLSQMYQNGFDLRKLDNVTDKDVKNLLVETKKLGYKVETAEGMFFPVIDYEAHKKYSIHLTPDLQEYINIMAIESNQTPAKDAALVIGWDEILRRIGKQEQFINQYQKSTKINDVQQLYKKYITFALFGANNTPLFDYDSKMMRDTAKNIYVTAISNTKESNFMTILHDFLDVLAGNNYKLTDKVAQYRKSISDMMLSVEDYTQPETIAAMQADIQLLKTESSVQQIEESNYGSSTLTTNALKVSEQELQFDAVTVIFAGNYTGHYTPGKSYSYYADAAMGGQRGITVKDNFGVWHSFGYRVQQSQ